MLFYDLLVIGSTFLFKERTANHFIFASLFGNPVDMTRVGSLIVLNSKETFGVAGAALTKFLSGEVTSILLLVLGLTLWIVAPFLLSQWLLRGQDILSMKFNPPIPHEHGAWAMLYAPLVIAVTVLARYELSAGLFLIATTAIFLAHEPLALLVKLNPKRPSSPQIFRAAKQWFAVYAALALIAIVLLLINYQRWYLVPFGVVLIALLSAHIYLASRREERTIGGEFSGVISLTFTALGAYYVVTGKLDGFCPLLWGLSISPVRFFT